MVTRPLSRNNEYLSVKGLFTFLVKNQTYDITFLGKHQEFTVHSVARKIT